MNKPIAASLPEAPTQPVVSDVTDTTVHLSWAPGKQNSQYPVQKFYVEYFGYETTDVRNNSLFRLVWNVILCWDCTFTFVLKTII